MCVNLGLWAIGRDGAAYVQKLPPDAIIKKILVCFRVRNSAKKFSRLPNITATVYRGIVLQVDNKLSLRRSATLIIINCNWS